MRGGGGGLGGGGGRGCGGDGGGGGEGSGGGEGGGEPSVSQVKVRCSGRVPGRGGSRTQSQRGRVPSEARAGGARTFESAAEALAADPALLLEEQCHRRVRVAHHLLARGRR